MKFTKFVLLAAAIMACACEKEMPTDTMPEATNNMTRTKTEILSFASVEEMEEQIGILRIMAPEEMAGWYAVQNFESQYDALYRAAEEIDNATTLEEAEAIKTKYSPLYPSTVPLDISSANVFNCSGVEIICGSSAVPTPLSAAARAQ